MKDKLKYFVEDTMEVVIPIICVFIYFLLGATLGLVGIKIMNWVYHLLF